MRLEVTLTDEQLDELAERAAAIVLERTGPTPSAGRFVTVPEAAELLRCRRQRVDDLLSQRRLSRFKEGGRTLLDRAEVEALVELDRVARTLPTAPLGRMAARPAG
jgi:excisionase family DNA binding protein